MFHQRNGNVAMLSALALVPIFGIAAISVDLGFAHMVRTQAQAAADAAALAVLAEDQEAARGRARGEDRGRGRGRGRGEGGEEGEGDGEDGDESEGFSDEQRGRDAFLANFKSLPGVVVENVGVDLNETDARDEATVTFRVRHQRYMASLFGADEGILEGVAVARMARNSFVDVHFWLDASASMGIAADEAGRDALRALSAADPSHPNCAFACHQPTHLSTPEFATSQDRAHANGVRLRVDLMKEQSERVVDALEEDIIDDNIRFSITSLSNEALSVLAPSTDLEAVREALRDFGLVHASRFPATLPAAAETVPDSGRGETFADRRQMVVLVTDGVAFNWGEFAVGGIDPSVCASLKSRGVSVAVVHLRYVRLDGDWAFEHYIAPIYNQISPALRACASPRMYFSADTPDEIERAFRDLTQSLREKLRLVT